MAALAKVETGMTHIAGFERDQLLLLPEAVDDYVEADNPVRFIDAFVEGLDLAAAGFVRVAAKATGRPGYAPGDLLKLYIYGYLNRVRSSRRLEREAQRNIEVIWHIRNFDWRGDRSDFHLVTIVTMLFMIMGLLDKKPNGAAFADVRSWAPPKHESNIWKYRSGVWDRHPPTIRLAKERLNATE